METINELLKALDNKVPSSIAKRLDGLRKMNEKLSLARKEHEENTTDESKESLDEIVDFINDTEEDLQEDLAVIVEQKRNDEFNRAEAKRKAERERQAIKEAQEQERLKEKELEEKQLEEKALESDVKNDTEKKSGIGWGSLLLGGAILVLTGGAIKYFGNNR